MRLACVRNFDQVSIGITHIDRRDWSSSARARHWAFGDRDTAEREVINPFRQRGVREQTEVGRAGGRGSRIWSELCTRFVEVYFLRAKGQGFADFARRGGESRPCHTQTQAVKPTGLFDVCDREDQMVEGADGWFHINVP